MDYIRRKHQRDLKRIKEIKTMLSTGQLKPVRKRLARYCSIYGDYPETFYLAGVFYSGQGQFDLAIPHFDKGFSMVNGTRAQTNFPRRLTYDTAFVLAMYAEAVAGQALEDKADTAHITRASGIFRKILPLAADRSCVLSRLSLLHSKLGEPWQAAAYLARAIRSMDRDSDEEVVLDSINNYFRNTDISSMPGFSFFEAVARSFKRASRGIVQAAFYFHLGGAYEAFGDRRKAGEAFYRSLQVPYNSEDHTGALIARVKLAENYLNYAKHQLFWSDDHQTTDVREILDTVLRATFKRPFDTPDSRWYIRDLREEAYKLLSVVHPDDREKFIRKAKQESFLKEHPDVANSLEEIVTKPGIADDVVVPSVWQ